MVGTGMGSLSWWECSGRCAERVWVMSDFNIDMFIHGWLGEGKVLSTMVRVLRQTGRLECEIVGLGYHRESKICQISRASR